MRKFIFALILTLVSPAAHPAFGQTKVIAALGDSLTAGYGLETGQGFVPQMQAWLTARGHDVRLINAGVSGDTTAGGLARVDWTLSDDVQGVMVALGGNDLLRALPPEASRANMQGIATGITAKGLPLLIVGFKAPGNYGPDYQAEFDAIYPDLAAEFGAGYVPEFLGALRALGMDAGRAMMQADGIHPNADGVALIVQDLGPAFEELLQKLD